MPTRTSAQSGLWTSPSTWQGGTVPQAGDQVVIQSGHTVTYDVVENSANDVELGTSGTSLDIDIYGTLRFDTNATQPLRLRFRGYINLRNGARFEVGTTSNPMPVRVTIQKTTSASIHMIEAPSSGTRPTFSAVGSPNLPLMTDEWSETDYRLVTFLAANASAGATSITVLHNLNWSVGDLIFIPRPVAGLTTSVVGVMSFSVTSVTVNQNGTVTLGISPSIPSGVSLLANRTPVAKYNRLIRFIDPNTSTSYPYAVNNPVTVEALQWVIWERSHNSGYAFFRNPAHPAGGTLECRFCTAISGNGLAGNLSASATQINLYKCVTGEFVCSSNVPLRFEKSVLYGSTHHLIYGNQLITRSLLFNWRGAANQSGGIYVENSRCYNIYAPNFAMAFFHNCEFYGFSNLTNFGNAATTHAVFNKCKFYRSMDNSTTPHLGWHSYNMCFLHYEFVDCEFYESWSETSSWANSGVIGGQPTFPIVKFINKTTASGVIREQVYRSGGLITSEENDKPTGVPFSYKFEPKRSDYHIFYDVPVNATSLVRLWVKAGSGSPTFKVWLIDAKDVNLPLHLVTPKYELTVSPLPSAWTAYLIPVRENSVLRVLVQGASGHCFAIWEIVRPTEKTKPTLAETLTEIIQDKIIVRTLQAKLPMGY